MEGCCTEIDIEFLCPLVKSFLKITIIVYTPSVQIDSNTQITVPCNYAVKGVPVMLVMPDPVPFPPGSIGAHCANCPSDQGSTGGGFASVYNTNSRKQKTCMRNAEKRMHL